MGISPDRSPPVRPVISFGRLRLFDLVLGAGGGGVMASHYPRWRITTTACVLLCLGYLLLRLPLDQKSYAKESSKFLRRDNKEREKPAPKGGMVRLTELKSVPVNHDGSGATKQVRLRVSRKRVGGAWE